MERYLERADKKGEEPIRLVDGVNTFGRQPDNSIVLPADDRCVSGYHAVIYCLPDKLLLQDMQSTNGTYVNGSRIEAERGVKNGDEIGLGASGPRFRVVCSGADPAPVDVVSDSGAEALEMTPPAGRDPDGGAEITPTITIKTDARYKTIALAAAAIVTLCGFVWMIWFTSGGGRPKPAVERKANTFFSARGIAPIGDDDDPYSDFDGIGASAEPRSVEAKIDRILRRFGERDYQIPPEMIDRVEHYLKQYTGPMRRTIAKYMERRKIYFPMIRRVFTEKNIPLDLAYVSILESGLDPNALSHAGAKGLWQFMPKTARDYGLEVSAVRDERTDPEKSTYAAADYFKYLIAIFGSKSSVMLCMAAYNAGEGRVIGALRRIDDPVRNRDFWYIYRKKWLAEETNEYIPQVLALIIISEHPEEYGFE